MATKDNSVSERVMAEASGENPFTPCELLQEIEPLLHTYFLGNFGWNGGTLIGVFPNGQEFRISVEEIV